MVVVALLIQSWTTICKAALYLHGFLEILKRWFQNVAIWMLQDCTKILINVMTKYQYDHCHNNRCAWRNCNDVRHLFRVSAQCFLLDLCSIPDQGKKNHEYFGLLPWGEYVTFIIWMVIINTTPVALVNHYSLAQIYYF